MVMPEDSPGVKVSAVRDTYGAEAGVQSSVKQWPFLIFFGIQDSHLFLEGIQQVPRSCGVFFQVRFCKATQEAREAMSADLVRELREKYGEAKAEEIHPNQEHNCFNAGFRSNKTTYECHGYSSKSQPPGHSSGKWPRISRFGAVGARARLGCDCGPKLSKMGSKLI